MGINRNSSLEFNVPKLTSPFSDDQNETNEIVSKIDACFRASTPYRTAAIVGAPCSGKTSTCVCYIRNREFGAKQYVAYFDASSPKLLDFDYRQFAYALLGARIDSRTRDELINEIKRVFDEDGWHVLYVFDNVVNLDDLKPYYQTTKLPASSQVIISSSLENLSWIESELCPAAIMYLDRGDRAETASLKQLEEEPFINDLKQIKEVLSQFYRSERISRGDVDMCCRFIKQTKLTENEFQEILNKTLPVTNVILEHLEKNKDNLNIDIEILIAISMLNASRVNLSFLAVIFSYVPEFLLGNLKQFEEYGLIRTLADSTNRYVRMENSQSERVYEWAKSKYSPNRINKLYSLLLVNIDELIELSPTNLERAYSKRYYYPHIIRLLNSKDDLRAEEKRAKEAHIRLHYKLACFELNFMCNARIALWLLNDVSYWCDNDLLMESEFVALVELAKGNCYDVQNDFKSAIAKKNIALEKHRKKITKDYIEILESLSTSYESDNQIEKAIACEKKALDLKLSLWKSSVEKAKSVSVSYYNIGLLYQKSDNSEQALEFFHRAYDILKDYDMKQVALEHLFALNSLMNIYQHVRNYNEANKYKDRIHQAPPLLYQAYFYQPKPSFKISATVQSEKYTNYEKITSDQNEEYNFEGGEVNQANRNFQIGLVNMNSGEYEKAIENFRQAYLVFKSHSIHTGEINCYDNLATCNLRLANHKEALNYIEWSRKFRLELYSNMMHPEMLISLYSKMEYLDATGKFKYADACRRTALRILEHAVWTRNIEYAKCLHQVGLKYFDIKNFELALTCIEHAYYIFEQNDESECREEKIKSLYYQAIIKYNLKRIAQAIQLAFRAKRMCEDSSIEKSYLADSFNLLGVFHFAKLDYHNAKVYFKKCYNIRVKIYDKNHSKIADCLVNLASVYEKLGEFKNANENFNMAYEMRNRYYQSNVPINVKRNKE